MPTISALVITYNEEKNIEEWIKNVGWVDEIIVVDSFSSDKTVEIAKKFTDHVFMNEFKDFSSQKNFALSKATSDWVLFLDADERISEDLKNRITASIKEEKYKGFYIKRNTYIFGKLMKHGGHNKDYQLKLFKREGAGFYQPVHEKVGLSHSKIGYIEEPIRHYSSNDLSEYIFKLNLYTDLEAKFMSQKGVRCYLCAIIFKPLIRYIQKYFLERGFQDGREGFIFYTLSFYYDFIKYIKYWELSKEKISHG